MSGDLQEINARKNRKKMTSKMLIMEINAARKKAKLLNAEHLVLVNVLHVDRF